MPDRAPEDVWSYPRSPRIDRAAQHARVQLDDAWIADSTDVVRVLETTHPPAIYLLASAFAPGVLREVPDLHTSCEWKGRASYFDILGPRGTVAERAAWAYPDPSRGFEVLADRVSLYPERVQSCWLDGELVRAQEGSFYGGWVTSWITGQMKGGPGTRGW